MKIFICLLLPLLGVNGKDCSEVEDPIKRDEAAPGPWNVSRVEWKPSGLQVRIPVHSGEKHVLKYQGALVPVTLGGSHPLGKTALYEGDAYVIQYAVRCLPSSNSRIDARGIQSSVKVVSNTLCDQLVRPPRTGRTPDVVYFWQVGFKQLAQCKKSDSIQNVLNQF
jgi:hypothetical protein